MKNYKIFWIFLILFLFWILLYKIFTNIFEKNFNSSINFRWIKLSNYEMLDISDFYNNSNFYYKFDNFVNSKTFINWFGQIIYSIEPFPPIDLWDGNILKFEKIDEKNNLKYSHLQNYITGEEVYSVISLWPQN